MYSLKIAYLLAMLLLHELHLNFQVINSFVPLGNFPMQFFIGLFQFLHFPAAEKRTHSAYYDRSGIGGCTFELVRAYLRFSLDGVPVRQDLSVLLWCRFAASMRC